MAACRQLPPPAGIHGGGGGQFPAAAEDWMTSPLFPDLLVLKVKVWLGLYRSARSLVVRQILPPLPSLLVPAAGLLWANPPLVVVKSFWARPIAAAAGLIQFLVLFMIFSFNKYLSLHKSF